MRRNHAGDRRDAGRAAVAPGAGQLAERAAERAGRARDLRALGRAAHRAGNALLASLYAGSDPPRQQPSQREQERWETIAARRSALIGHRSGQSEFGPEQRPDSSRRRYFANATEESLRLNALQDAANEEASAVDQRAAAYTAILAMLAVSLYLFGLTLAVVGRWLRLGFLSRRPGPARAWARSWMAPDGARARLRTPSDEAATEYAKRARGEPDRL